jgi:hypothetical protein
MLLRIQEVTISTLHPKTCNGKLARTLSYFLNGNIKYINTEVIK